MWTQALVGVLLAANVAMPAAAPTTTTVTVNSGAATTPLRNPAWNQNQAGPLLTSDQIAKVKAFSPQVTRVWVSPKEYVKSPGVYNFDSLDQAIVPVAGYSKRIMVNLLPCHDEDLADPPVCEKYLMDGLRHFKQQFPALEYVEIFNEPDKWWPVTPGTDPAMTPAQYYPWYSFGYRMVNELNAELQPEIPMKVGGPVGAAFNYHGYFADFLGRYKADTDPAKRLDFISWHEYNVPNTPAAAGQEKAQLRDLLDHAGLPTTIPGYVTESGVFPGDTNDGPVLADDQLVQAAAMASLGTYFTLGGIDGVFQWTFQQKNERKSMFVNGTGNVLPYYNVVRMESMLKSGLLPAATFSPKGPDNGLGVSALPTKDNTGEAVLLANYQGLKGTAAQTVTLDPGTLPWPGHAIRVERYLVNKTTSNYNYSPAQQSLAKVEDFTLAAGASAKRTITLQPNAISLFVYTPQPYVFETESLHPAVSGGTQTNIADAAASGGMLNKYVGTKAGDAVTYPFHVAADGTYAVTLRVKHTPDRGVFQTAVDGVPLGDPIDGWLDGGYSYSDGVPVGTRYFGAGDHTMTFTLTDATTHGPSIGIDNFTLSG